MKYIECECCGFIGVIPSHDSYKDLICPFCYKANCQHGGKFIQITISEFNETVKGNEITVQNSSFSDDEVGCEDD